jgi:DNA-binding NtrC family response regulator
VYPSRDGPPDRAAQTVSVPGATTLDSYPIDDAERAWLLDALEPELARLASPRATVLLVGESPQLCEWVARALHDRSPRRAERFASVDCRTLDDAALETTLFGGPAYEVEARGLTQKLERGTFHVAGVDRIPPLLQPRFLRYLDSTKRARVVASTAVDLNECLRAGSLRDDLGRQLLLVQLRMPSR